MVSHPLSMREALGSILSVCTFRFPGSHKPRSPSPTWPMLAALLQLGGGPLWSRRSSFFLLPRFTPHPAWVVIVAFWPPPFLHVSMQRPCGLMDKALVFGTKDCRFESCQGHLFAFPSVPGRQVAWSAPSVGQSPTAHPLGLPPVAERSGAVVSVLGS